MKKIKIRVMCSLMCIVGCLSTLHAQLVFKTTSPSVIAYYEYVPEDYHTNSNKYPVVFFLHGIGERGPNTTDLNILKDNIYKVAKIGPAKFVKSGTKFPFILIAPQLKNNNGLWSSKYVMEVINHAKKYLRIDERRIYLTGLSLGGGGTWVTAQDYAREFAAIAPVCGGYNSTSKAINLAKENLPVWAFHGDKDTIVPLSRSVNMVNAINGCTPKPSPLAKLTIYPGVAHNAWDYAYKPDHTVHNPNVYDWLLKYTNTINAGNKIPVANAGADQAKTLSSTSTTLTGSGSDVDGSIVSYAWTKISGPSATLTNTLSRTLSISKLVSGTYMFRLTVKDNNGNTDSDYVKVTVSGTGSGTTNISPIANAGADKSITLPTNYTSITGSGADNDGSIASYSWIKISGGTASLSGTSSAKLNVSNMVAGTYVFRLTVKDNSGATDSDDVTVVVKSTTTTANAVPVANAGPNVSVTLPKNYATITGSGKDSDGSVVSYTWTKIRGGSAVLNGANTSNLSVSGLSEGWYVFRLTVKDDKGATDYDDMGLMVSSSSM